MKRNKNDRNNRGFSLVETIIVVAILATLVSVLAPMYVSYIQKSKINALESDGDEFRKVFETAVVEAEVKGYIPAAGSVVVYDGTLKNLWGDDGGNLIHDHIDRFFGDDFGKMKKIVVNFGNEGEINYFDITFLDGNKNYEYYFFTRQDIRSSLPNAGQMEEISGGWYYIK